MGASRSAADVRPRVVGPACGMRAMMVAIGLESEELAFEIGACSEQGTVQALAAEGAD
jgi:hypothetical protein